MYHFKEFTASTLQPVSGLMPGLAVCITHLNPEIKLLDHYNIEIDHNQIVDSSMYILLDKESELASTDDAVPVTLEYSIHHKKSSNVPLKQESTIYLSKETIQRLSIILKGLEDE